MFGAAAGRQGPSGNEKAVEFDARKFADQRVIETDLCVVGAGPAGITLAREFIGTDVHVTLLDSGGCERDEDLQELSDGAASGPYTNPRETHHRQAGGTARLWNIPLEQGMAAKYVFNELLN